MAPGTSLPIEQERLTDQGYWDGYWRGVELPLEVRRDPRAFQLDALLDVLDAHLVADRGATALEIGGAPGQYLAYLHRRLDVRCALLDFSPAGCALARRNFELLGIPVELHERDLLDPELAIGPFDIAFSLGLIEHFADLDAVVGAHARLVKPGGTLILGAPNVVGLNRWFMARLGPARLAVHNPENLELGRWDGFERRLGLERRFRGYVGGFEPSMFAVLERRTPRSLLLWALTAVLVRTVGRVRWLRRFNTPRTSGYLIGVYRVP